MFIIYLKIINKQKEKIISKEPEDHQSVTIEYYVEGKKFNFSGYVERAGKSFANARINDKFTVYYDPNKPEIAYLRSPNDLFQSSVIETLIIICIPIILLIIYMLQKAKFHKEV